MEEEEPDRCYLSLSNKYLNTPRIYKRDYNHTQTKKRHCYNKY